MNKLQSIRRLLQEQARNLTNYEATRFFKTTPGSYAAHDAFMGVSVPILRKVSKSFSTLTLPEIKKLLQSKINEERLLALFILVLQYQHAGKHNEKIVQEQLFQFYLSQLHCVNNWNLVDASAHHIIGAYLYLKKDRNILLELAISPSLWERRIAIVATLYFIRQNDLKWTFKLAKILLNDTHDLIHKAVGWMLREAGKKNTEQLVLFLEKQAKKMPRVMLRYAVEKFPEKQRKLLLFN